MIAICSCCRVTVDGVLGSDGPPKYQRPERPAAFETQVRALLEELPETAATVLAERVGWDGSITWFRDNLRKLRPEHRRPGQQT